MASSASSISAPPKPLTSYRPFWAKRLGTAPFLPMSRAEMAQLGWDACDIILVSGDAYVDHPSFGMAVIGRVLESQGFRVGILAQPDWHSAEPFRALGRPTLFFGVAAGNMDSMINHYTADRKIRSDDAYTPGGVAGKRPDRATLIYTQRCKEAFKDVPVVIGGIEASLRRIAHYDYWSDKVRRSILVDSKADLLLYGNAERAIIEIAHRMGRKEPIEKITDVRGTAFVRRPGDPSAEGWFEIDSSQVDLPGRIDEHINPYQTPGEQASAQGASCARETGGAEGEDASTPAAPESLYQTITFVPPPAPTGRIRMPPRERSVIRLPSYEQVCRDPVLYAHASRVLHLETNPGNARALVQLHGEGPGQREVWINPPPIPLSMEEMDHVFDLPYARSPHPAYADENGSHDGATKIPAWEMIRFSVNIMRGCFGGCTFCSITEHEGRIIQSRSEDSVIQEIEQIRDRVKGFTGVISDLGGPTANMYRLGCKSPEIEAACRKPSCVWPGICQNLTTDHGPLIKMYRRARALKGVKKILIGSGLRYDLAIKSPEYIRELVTHHVGGYLKIAPEHTEAGPLELDLLDTVSGEDRDALSGERGQRSTAAAVDVGRRHLAASTSAGRISGAVASNSAFAVKAATISPSAVSATMYQFGSKTSCISCAYWSRSAWVIRPLAMALPAWLLATRAALTGPSRGPRRGAGRTPPAPGPPPPRPPAPRASPVPTAPGRSRRAGRARPAPGAPMGCRRRRAARGPSAAGAARRPPTRRPPRGRRAGWAGWPARA